MGEHRNNSRAIAASKPAQRFPPGSEIFGFQLQSVLELNKTKMAEVTAIIDAAKNRGEDPRFAVPKWNPTDNPEWFDYVVYNVPTLGRPSALAIDPRQIPTATIRWSEHLRIPLLELRARADGAFAEVEAAKQGQSH